MNVLKYILISLAAAILVLLTYLPIYLPDTFSGKEYVIKALSKASNKNTDKQTLDDFRKKFLLVNTSYDLSLGHLERTDKKMYHKSSAGATTITNRLILYKLLKWLVDHPENYNVVIVDVLFYNKSFLEEEKPYDDSLSIVLKKLADTRKIILAADYDKKNVIIPDNYNTSIGIEAYADVRANILSEKHEMYLLSAQRDVASMPLVMLSKIDSVDIKHSKTNLISLQYPDGKTEWSFNNISPKDYINQTLIDSLNVFGYSHYNKQMHYINLGDIRNGTNGKLNTILPLTQKKRNIFIGAFSGQHTDLHNSIYGRIAGPLYLLNIYYNLLYKKNHINEFEVALLFIVYFFCIVGIVIPQANNYNEMQLSKMLLKKIVLERWFYFVLILVTILYYYIFDVVIDLVFLGIIFIILDIIFHNIRQIQARKEMLERENIRLEAEVAARMEEVVAEKQKSDKLLLNILPAEIAEELKTKGKTEARYYENVSVIFTDFVGFTSASERMTARQLVSELDNCFKAFDAIITKYKIEKIKTIGDAYLAVCGLPEKQEDHAVKTVLAAIDILRYLRVRKQEYPNNAFDIRIGIHTGPVVAGVVGDKKYAYDIWGDTVNTAARMESSGEANKINISQATYNLVKNHFECTDRGAVAAKNKGELNMYFVDGIKE